ncbi:hypothetical protein DENSPDRAFT_295720 [Dentipellis sp. KUC8613]|nr:hypothetical protein DENSPDRAFT_295720 [Dentipellis sp. KUC8613]
MPRQQQQQKQLRKGNRSIIRDPIVTRSRSQLNVASCDAVPSHASGSGGPHDYLELGSQATLGAPYFPMGGLSSFRQHGQPVLAAASWAISHVKSSESETRESADPVIRARAHEKVAWAISSPKAKHQMTEEERKRRNADKAQKKRDRDVEDRVRLNNVLPEDRQAVLDRPGPVEVMRNAIEYIIELRSECVDLRAELHREQETNRVIRILIGAQETEVNSRASDCILEMQEEIRSLRARLSGQST